MYFFYKFYVKKKLINFKKKKIKNKVFFFYRINISNIKLLNHSIFDKFPILLNLHYYRFMYYDDILFN